MKQKPPAWRNARGRKVEYYMNSIDNIITQDQNNTTGLADLVKAFAKAQSEIGSVEKDKYNQHFRSHYASLDAILSHVRPIFAHNGLAIIQKVDGDKGVLLLKTIIYHVSGQSLCSYYPIYVDKQHPQALGAAVSYARRYSLNAMLGIGAEETDDDGNNFKQSETKPNVPQPIQQAPASSIQAKPHSPSLERQLVHLCEQNRLPILRVASEALRRSITDAAAIKKIPDDEMTTVIKYIKDKYDDVPVFSSEETR